jgi:hypothetical protein
LNKVIKANFKITFNGFIQILTAVYENDKDPIDILNDIDDRIEIDFIKFYSNTFNGSIKCNYCKKICEPKITGNSFNKLIISIAIFKWFYHHKCRSKTLNLRSFYV